MPTPHICLMCEYWEEGFCDCEEAPSYGIEDVDAGATCPCWSETEIFFMCSTCVHWVMYRRNRVCSNPEMREYGLLMKPSECCGNGWREKDSVLFVIKHNPS